jgi:glutathione peroxidase
MTIFTERIHRLHGEATSLRAFSGRTILAVNGDARHAISSSLTEVADAEDHSGDIRWNFEEFLITPDGTVTRHSPMIAADDVALVAALEASLPN